MDLADAADDLIENEIQHHLRMARRPKELRDGHCLNCNAELPTGTALYCDDDCRADWEAREEARKRNGQ